jgi:hypothetical protein
LRRSHVLAALTTVAALCFALPAVGATSSPLKIAKQALTNSKSAKKTAASAKKTALTAKSSSSSANKKAQSALDALKKPVAAATNAVNAVNAVNSVNAQNATKATNADAATHAGSADNVVVLPLKKVDVSATEATQAAARTAATAIPLVTRGPLTVYAKCFKDSSGPSVRGEVYVKSSADRSTLASDDDSLVGPAVADFLNADTLETDATVSTDNVANNSSDIEYSDDGQFQAVAADGTYVDGYVNIGVKQGTLPGGNGPYPANDGCTFNGVLNLG